MRQSVLFLVRTPREPDLPVRGLRRTSPTARMMHTLSMLPSTTRFCPFTFEMLQPVDDCSVEADNAYDFYIHKVLESVPRAVRTAAVRQVSRQKTSVWPRRRLRFPPCSRSRERLLSWPKMPLVSIVVACRCPASKVESAILYRRGEKCANTPGESYLTSITLDSCF